MTLRIEYMIVNFVMDIEVVVDYCMVRGIVVVSVIAVEGMNDGDFSA